jgi:hypothetical protein
MRSKSVSQDRSYRAVAEPDGVRHQRSSSSTIASSALWCLLMMIEDELHILSKRHLKAVIRWPG